MVGAGMTMSDLAGRTVLITGASSGIGWSLAKEFAAQGARLALVARRVDRLNRLADDLAGAPAGRPLVFRRTLSERGQAAALAGEVGESLGAVNVLVNNAVSAVGARRGRWGTETRRGARSKSTSGPRQR